MPDAVKRLTVGNRAQAFQGSHRLRHRIERLRLYPERPFARTAMAQRPFRFLLLDVGAVEQEHAKQVDGRRRRIHRPAIAEHAETWQQAGMVDMGMRQQHEIEFAHVERQGIHVLPPGIAPGTCRNRRGRAQPAIRTRWQDPVITGRTEELWLRHGMIVAPATCNRF